MKMPCDVKRYWFEYDDGTFYRNCPLIMREQEKAGRLGLFRLADKLHQEFWETFRRGVQYKETLGHGEVSIPSPRTPISILLPDLAGRIPADKLAEWDTEHFHRPLLPGDPEFRWHFQH